MTIALTNAMLSVLGGVSYNGIAGAKFKVTEDIVYPHATGSSFSIANSEGIEIDLDGHGWFSGGHGGASQALGINVLNCKGVKVKNGYTRGFQYFFYTNETGAGSSPATYSTDRGAHVAENIRGSALFRLLTLRGLGCRAEHIHGYRNGGANVAGHSEVVEFCGPGQVAHDIWAHETYSGVIQQNAEVAVISFSDQNHGSVLSKFGVVNQSVEVDSIGLWVQGAEDMLIEKGIIRKMAVPMDIGGSGIIRDVKLFSNTNAPLIGGTWDVTL